MQSTPSRVVSLTAAALLVCVPARAQTPPSEPGKPARTPTPVPAAKLADASTVFESAQVTTLAEGLKFTEGPLWREGELLFCDLAGDAVYTLATRTHDAPDPKPVEFRSPAGKAAGAALDPQGRLILAHFEGYVSRTENDGTITRIATAAGDAPLARCNDLAVRSDGTIYFTDFGKKDSPSKGLFRIDIRGGVTNLSTDFGAANGVALSPDHTRLYVADYTKSLIIAFDVAVDGGVSNRRVFADLSTEDGQGKIDGLKTDGRGRVFSTGPGGIWVFSARGERVTRLDLANGASNLCFGGSDGRTLFITSGSKVLCVRVKPE